MGLTAFFFRSPSPQAVLEYPLMARFTPSPETAKKKAQTRALYVPPHGSAELQTCRAMGTGVGVRGTLPDIGRRVILMLPIRMAERELCRELCGAI